MPTDTEIAWAAVLFEGEGWIGMNGVSVSLSIEMADRDVLARYARLLSAARSVVPMRRNPTSAAALHLPHRRARTGPPDLRMVPAVARERRAAKMRELMPHILPPRPTAPDSRLGRAGESWSDPPYPARRAAVRSVP